MQKKFLTAEWRKLIMANYVVDPSILKKYLPYKTELDIWDGKCFVSLIGFRFLHTKLKGFAIPFHVNFEEVNLRFYVRYKDGGTWKRGTTFIKEIVPKPAITFVANLIYNEKYVTMPTSSSWETNNETQKILYKWKHHRQWDQLFVEASTKAADILPGSLEEFITEHYWGYTLFKTQTTSQYEVEHPRWQTYQVISHDIRARFGLLYGDEFKTLTSTLPDSILLAEGSPVSIRAATSII